MQKLVVHRTRNFNQTTKTFAQAWHIYAEVRFGMFYGDISCCGATCVVLVQVRMLDPILAVFVIILLPNGMFFFCDLYVVFHILVLPN